MREMTYLEFQVTLAIRLSLQVYQEASYLVWAHNWLDGSDRSKKSAAAAYSYPTAYAYPAAAYAAVAADCAAASNNAADANYAAAYANYAANYADISIKKSIKLEARLEAVVKFL